MDKSTAQILKILLTDSATFYKLHRCFLQEKGLRRMYSDFIEQRESLVKQLDEVINAK